LSGFARRAGAAAAAALALAAAAPGQVRAQARAVGPTVRALATLSPGDRALLVRDTVAAGLAAVTRDADGAPVAHLVIRLRSGADTAAVRQAGARLGTRIGDLVTARVPLGALQQLLSDGTVAAVYGARRWAPLNDVGTAAIGVASLRQMVAPDSFVGPVGRGVIVGLVDTGLDFGHADFMVDALGRSRVLYLWDQTLSGPGPGLVGTTSFTYGVECGQASLGAGSCTSRDSLGHGTHVMGTAAGDGSATANGVPAGKYAGVAPGADLIVVKTTFLSDAVVDGVSYVFARAAELGRPAVVNLSIGSQAGPHDGTLPEELLLDSLEGPGRIVVASDGNWGDNENTTPAHALDRVHAAATLSAGGPPASFTLTVPAYVPAPGQNNDLIFLELWYGGADTATVTVTRPDGSSLTSPATASPPASATQDEAQGQILIQNGPGDGVAETADNLAYVVLGDLGVGAAPQPGTWTISVTALASHSGRPAHLWVADGALGASASLAGVSLVNGTNAYLVSSPAAASRVLAVGAYVTREQWQDSTGASQQYTYQERLGDLANFSSPGPRRDGVLKPDLVAPGQGIASSLSRYAAAPVGLTTADGRHWILAGTSQAAPFVTGAVALLLEQSPRLTPEAARALLIGAAQVDSFARHPFDGAPDGSPNASWGYGKLSVPAAIATLARQGVAPINLSENPVRGSSVTINYTGTPRVVAIYTFTGVRVRSFAAPPAGSVTWDLTTDDGRPVVNGVYVVVVDLGGSVARRRLYVARRAP
jgi:hypothetical protein